MYIYLKLRQDNISTTLRRYILTVPWLMLQCVAVCCSVLQCVAVCCRVLQRVAVCSIYNWDTTTYPRLCIDTFLLPHDSCCSVLQHVAVCCSVYNWDTTIYPRLCIDTFPLPHDSCLPVHMACHNCPKKKVIQQQTPSFDFNCPMHDSYLPVHTAA